MRFALLASAVAAPVGVSVPAHHEVNWPATVLTLIVCTVLLGLLVRLANRLPHYSDRDT